MRPLRICVYGGTSLQGAPVEFVEALSYALLSSGQPTMIVTGGFRHSEQRPEATSTDSAALRGARLYQAEHGAELRDLYEACLPGRALDDRRRSGGAVRMTEEDGISVRRMPGRTPLGRRLAMVRDVDAVVTVSGGRQTEVVIEQAIELGLPTIPIPDRTHVAKKRKQTSASHKLLDQHRRRIESGFADGAFERALTKIKASLDTDPSGAAKVVADLLVEARIGRCLVLMPFDEPNSARYQRVIVPAVETYMQPVRLDLLEASAPIFRNLESQIDHARAIVANVTDCNENIMYEVGYAHSRGLEPLLFTTDASRLDELPVYVRHLNVHLAENDGALDRLIRARLAHDTQR